MQAIETVRTGDDYRAKVQRALDHELSRAAAGLTPTVSTKAAAQYLGVHFDTLGEWRRRSPPLGPPFQKGPGGSAVGANQHVRYLYQDLVHWQRARIGRSAQERRLASEQDTLQQEIRELEQQLAVKKAKAEREALQKAVGRRLSFLSLHDCVSVSHGWAMSHGRIAGHVLTVSDEVLDHALDEGQIWDGSLSDALLQAWTSMGAREPFHVAMSRALDDAQSRLRTARAGMRQDELGASLGPSTEAAFLSKDDGECSRF